MPIDFANSQELNNDLLNCSEEILRKLDLVINSDEKGEDSDGLAIEEEIEPVTTEKKEGRKKSKVKKAEIRSENERIQISLSREDMIKARFVAISRGCTLNSLFVEIISRHINSLFNADKENIEKLTNSILKK